MTIICSFVNSVSVDRDGSLISHWKRLQRDDPDLLYFRDYDDIPLDLVSLRRAVRLGLEVSALPVGYVLTRSSARIVALFRVRGL